MMRASERDEEIKIPKWYMKFPIDIMEKISHVIIVLVKLFPSKKRKKDTGKVRFYN